MLLLNWSHLNSKTTSTLIHFYHIAPVCLTILPSSDWIWNTYIQLHSHNRLVSGRLLSAGGLKWARMIQNGAQTLSVNEQLNLIGTFPFSQTAMAHFSQCHRVSEVLPARFLFFVSFLWFVHGVDIKVCSRYRSGLSDSNSSINKTQKKNIC